MASDLVEQALGSGLVRAELDRLTEGEAALERMSKGGRHEGQPSKRRR